VDDPAHLRQPVTGSGPRPQRLDDALELGERLATIRLDAIRVSISEYEPMRRRVLPGEDDGPSESIGCADIEPR